MNSLFSLRPIAPVLMRRTFGLWGSSLTRPPDSFISLSKRSTDTLATFENSTMTAPPRSFRLAIESRLQMTLISARERRLWTSSGTGPKRSSSSLVQVLEVVLAQ